MDGVSSLPMRSSICNWVASEVNGSRVGVRSMRAREVRLTGEWLN